jgi:hypothetical protein
MDRANSDVLVATAAVAEWKDPSVEAPPRGTKILLLTEWGVAVLGHWDKVGRFAAWSPLPKIPESIRRRMR